MKATTQGAFERAVCSTAASSYGELPAESRVPRAREPDFSRSSEHLEAIEAERSRIALDLHDGVLQTLSGIALQIEAASRLIDTDSRAARARLDAIGRQLVAEQADVRAFIHQLRPVEASAPVATAEFSAALRRLRLRMEQLRGVRIKMTVDAPAGVPDSLTAQILRIVQEALSNAARHARAKLVRVEISLSGASARIMVSDDGVGFAFRGSCDLATLKARNWGPASIRERVAKLGGELIVTSTLSGSTLDIALPIEHMRSNRLSGAAVECA